MSMNLPLSVRDAVINGDLPQIQAALQSGLNIDAADENGNTLLMSAAMEGHDNIVKYLLGKGADIKKKTPAEDGQLFGPLQAVTFRL